MTDVDLLEAQAKLLSIAPAFDEATASDMIKVLGDELAVGASRGGSHALSNLSFSGLLTRHGKVWRIADAVRYEFLSSLRDTQPETYARAVTLFVSHARNGSAPVLEEALGKRACDLAVASLELAIADNEKSAFESVVRQVLMGSKLGRESDLRLAEIYVGRLPQGPDRIRQIAFLRGLQLWHGHDRETAHKLFEEVLQAGCDDLPDAISAHLVGVHVAAKGEYDSAAVYLRHAMAFLRGVGDNRGLMMVLTSLGGVEREAFSRSVSGATGEGDSVEHIKDGPARENEDLLEAAQGTLNEALELAQKLNDGHQIGLVSLELASLYLRAEEFEMAIDLAKTARGVLEPSDPQYLRSLILLGSLYRSIEDIDQAAAALEEAAQIATENDASAAPLAQMLNVLASVERRQKNLGAARRHAEMSVSLGRRFSNRRHLAQALNTLARILVDMADDIQHLEVAQARLDESKALLEILRDTRGLKMAQSTDDILTLRRTRMTPKGEGD